MSLKPVIGVIVEVDKPEYDKLVRVAEKVEVLKRLYEKNKYISTAEIVAVLEIKEEE